MYKIKPLCLICFLVLSISVYPLLVNSDTENETEPLFSINLLSPLVTTYEDVVPGIVEFELPKIGIGISFHETTAWGNILPRTWYYPVGEEGYYDYIPSFDEGGYDVLFVGWVWGFDWDPTGLFDSASIVPNGDNVYQYNNSEFDKVLSEYTSEYDISSRITKAKRLQSILYEDLPTISIIYERKLFALSENLTGIDTSLLLKNAQRPEKWRNPSKDSITYALPIDLTEYNIFVKDSYHNAQWMSCVYYGLFERTQYDHLMEPVLARNYTISEDNKTFIVDINPNAYFSNGDPVTAYDVDYTYELYMSPAIAGDEYSDSFHRYTYLTTYFEDNNSIVALDNDTVQFTLKQPYAFTLNLLSYGIVNKELVQAYIEENGYEMEVLDQALVTGAGPFRLDVADFKKEKNYVTLHPNPYWKLTDDKMVENLRFTSIDSKSEAIKDLAAGNINIVDTFYKSVLEDCAGINANIVVTNNAATREMAINMRHPILGTGELTPLGTTEAAKNIRKAISYAIPRENISEMSSFPAVPGVTPMPDGCVGFDKTLPPYSYDLELAKSLMEKAGYKYGIAEPTYTEKVWFFLLSLIGLSSLVMLRRLKK